SPHLTLRHPLTPLDLVSPDTDDRLQFTRRSIRYGSNLPAARNIHEILAVHLTDVNKHRLAVDNRVHSRFNLTVDIECRSKIVHGAHRYDAQSGTLVKISHAVQHFIDRAVTAYSNYKIKTDFTCCVCC